MHTEDVVNLKASLRDVLNEQILIIVDLFLCRQVYENLFNKTYLSVQSKK
jgi:hypothetical protein